jgi:hypothetical protein
MTGHPPQPPLAQLEAAGFPVHELGEDELAVLSDLTPEEVRLLLDIKRRLDAAEPEVQAHVTVAGAGLF